jgi:hypothetical protein
MEYLACIEESNNLYIISENLMSEEHKKRARYDFLFCVNLVKLFIWLAFVDMITNLWV